MEGLLFCWSPDSPTYNATWHLHLNEDPAEILKVRRRQLVQMARYGHAASADELLGWGGVELREFRALYAELADILEAERPTTGIET